MHVFRVAITWSCILTADILPPSLLTWSMQIQMSTFSISSAASRRKCQAKMPNTATLHQYRHVGRELMLSASEDIKIRVIDMTERPEVLQHSEVCECRLLSL